MRRCVVNQCHLFTTLHRRSKTNPRLVNTMLWFHFASFETAWVDTEVKLGASSVKSMMALSPFWGFPWRAEEKSIVFSHTNFGFGKCHGNFSSVKGGPGRICPDVVNYEGTEFYLFLRACVRKLAIFRVPKKGVLPTFQG